MNILVIGSGGREHAIVNQLKSSPRAGEIFCIPGNGGIARDACVYDISPSDFKSIEKFANEKNIELIIVGPEAQLAAGIKDYFIGKKALVYGPCKKGALLESSKIYAKEFMRENDIPTAEYKSFKDPERALKYVTQKKDIVIKADGLCGGKGVVLPSGREEARATVQDFMIKKTKGGAGLKLLVEEKLKGEEVSVLLMVSGDNMAFFIPSQDHKPVFEGGKGPNTGGMGAYAPASIADEGLMKKIKEKIAYPALKGLLKRKIHYEGILYLGLMICEGEPYLLEFNVRFGDPEAQAVLPLMKNDLLESILRLKEGKDVNLSFKKGSCLDLVLASGGYPGTYSKGFPIEIGSLPEDVFLFHAGTRREGEKFYTNGGRVINIAALGEDINQAAKKAYKAAGRINFKGMHYRRDIGKKEIKRCVKQ
ncbi:MAG: phosphoribosylamine--glycine ligase [Elusimicrobiota bacterium]